MTKELIAGAEERKRYSHVPIGSVRGRRSGKHRELMSGILHELHSLPQGAAMRIPLGKVALANLRSALHRAAKSDAWTLETAADKENLYIWKKEKQARPKRIRKLN